MADSASTPVSSLTREQFLEQLTTCSVQTCAAVDQTTTCTICNEDGHLVDPDAMLVGEFDEHAVLLHGRHAFGEVCARAWLESQNTCPKCRTVLFGNGGDDDEVADDGVEIDLVRGIPGGDIDPSPVHDEDIFVGMNNLLRLWFQYRAALADVLGSASDDGSE